MPQDRGLWLSTATALFFSWAVLSIVVRVWVTLSRKQSWGHSDTAIAAGFALTIVHVSTTFRAIHEGYGRPLADIKESQLGSMQKALFTSQIFYVAAIGLTRSSTALFIGNLTRHPAQVRMSYILASLTGVWTAVSILVIAIRPDIARPWETLDGTQALFIRWSAIEATGLAIEVALWFFSISLIWGLQMKLRKRTLILIAFGSRLLLIPGMAVRLYYLAPNKNREPTLTNILAHILTEGALEYAIIASSVTTLKPFLKPFHAGAIVNTVGGTGSGVHSGSRSGQQDIYMLSSFNKTKKEQELATMSTVQSTKGDGDPPSLSKIYTGKTVPATTEISSQPEPQRDDIDSVGSDSSEHMIIRTTKNWSVRYEGQG